MEEFRVPISLFFRRLVTSFGEWREMGRRCRCCCWRCCCYCCCQPRNGRKSARDGPISARPGSLIVRCPSAGYWRGSARCRRRITSSPRPLSGRNAKQCRVQLSCASSSSSSSFISLMSPSFILYISTPFRRHRWAPGSRVRCHLVNSLVNYYWPGNK